MLWHGATKLSDRYFGMRQWTVGGDYHAWCARIIYVFGQSTQVCPSLKSQVSSLKSQLPLDCPSLKSQVSSICLFFSFFFHFMTSLTAFAVTRYRWLDLYLGPPKGHWKKSLKIGHVTNTYIGGMYAFTMNSHDPKGLMRLWIDGCERNIALSYPFRLRFLTHMHIWCIVPFRRIRWVAQRKVMVSRDHHA